MSKMILALSAAGLSCLAAAPQDEFKVDEKGFIRNWLVLAPIPCENENSGADEIDMQQIKEEAGLKPKEGDKTTVRGKALAWKKVGAAENFIDFRKLVKEEEGEDAVAYAVAYILADEELKGLKLKVGTNDQGKVYLNGKQVFKFTETRVLEEDSDTVKDVALNKGQNIVIFKVINEKNNWQGCLRFTDGDDKPVKSLRIALAPQ